MTMLLNLRGTEMLTIAIILFVLWLLGLLSMPALGYWVHVLLIVAIIVVVLNALQGRRTGLDG